MDKDQRLLDAMEHPDRYSDEELLAMLDDADMRESYDMISLTKAAMSRVPDPDIDAEWKTFSERRIHGRRTWIVSLLGRRPVAAALIGLLVTVAAVAGGIAVRTAFVSDSKAEPEAVAEVATVEVNTGVSPDIITRTDSVAGGEKVLVFRDETLAAIIDTIAVAYDFKADFRNEKVKELRLYFNWNRSLTLPEVVERLNHFEQINISLSEGELTID